MADQNFVHPTLDVWKKLYKETIEFKELGPWEWVLDTDLFSIKNPLSGEMGYCCIVGNIGLCFGLIVYLGAKGFAYYLEMQHSLIDEKDMDEHLSRNRCLALTFGSKRHLLNKDLAVIKELGFAFEGKNAWPQFRSYYPGYHPWYFTDDEAKFMLVCLEQAKGIVLRLREKPQLLTPGRPNLVFTRVPEKKEGKISWTDAWLEPPPYREIVTVKKDIDMERLKRIKKTAKITNMIWESDFFYAPARIAEKGKRPYSPILTLWTDQNSYFILNTHLSAPDTHWGDFSEQFLLAMEKNKLVPAEMWVRKQEFRSCIGPFAQYFGIKVKIKKKLKSIDAAQKSMFDAFTKRGGI